MLVWQLELVAFSPGYLRCARCETLVWGQMPGSDIARVANDEVGFYAREYWFAHQERDLGYPNILARARTDLPERCLHWLRTLLKYKLPPGRVLELGSGPGAFVAMLQSAGFEATGLEISPWVVQFIRDTFQVPVLLGPVEDQQIEPESLDVIALMDVFEHLPDPLGTMRHCLRLLRPDGILIIQTPRYPEGARHEEMVAQRDRFLEALKPTDHLYLFSRQSIREFFDGVGAGCVSFETALFAEYDMFLVVSRVPPVIFGPADIDVALSARPASRIIQSLLDLDTDRSVLNRRYLASEADRAARLEALEAQGQQLGEAEAERNELRAAVSALHPQLERSQADRAARLEVIETQGRRLGEVEAERNDLRAEVSALREHLERSEADRAARLEVIEAQGRRLAEVEAERNEQRAELSVLREHLERSEADRAARLEVIEAQGRRLAEVEAITAAQGRRLAEADTQRNALAAEVTSQHHQIHVAMTHLRNLLELINLIQATRAYKLLRLLRRWNWFKSSSSVIERAQEMCFDVDYAHLPETKKKE